MTNCKILASVLTLGASSVDNNNAYLARKRMIKADKDFAKKLDFTDIKFLVKVRDIHKIEKKNPIGISVFGYEN